MLKLSHIAIASPDLQKAIERFKVLQLRVAEVHDVPSERVKAAMLEMEASEHLRLELLEPTSTDSPISKFLEKRPKGGIHHLCFEVKGIEKWKGELEKAGIPVLPPGIRPGARGRVLFVDPRAMEGVLIELEEIADK